MIRVLIVCSKNSGKVAPFIVEQVEAISNSGIKTDYFYIQQKGISGYWSARTSLIQKIKQFEPTIIHAHYGLTGLLANLQRNVPVVTTYHGSDINVKWIRFFSRCSIYLSRYNIFVSQALIKKVKPKNNFECVPCGVDLSIFTPVDKQEARKKMGLEINEKYVLFSNSFSNTVKNYPLAKAAVERISGLHLLELKNYNREQVALLLNACDVALMTSFTEGSPQFIKEAMACNCPIVCVPVGDVAELISNTKGCYICSYEVESVEQSIRKSLDFNGRTSGREVVLTYDNKNIALRLKKIYETVLASLKP